MVNEITPPYYAELAYQKAEFNLRGKHFDLIPNDAIGVLARENGNPTELVNTSSAVYLLEVMNRIDDTDVTFEQGEIHNLSTPVYLGAIVSLDRQTIYWVNRSQPLP